MAKVTTKTLSVDVGISTFEVIMSNNEKYIKTIEGTVHIWNGFMPSAEFYKSKDYDRKLAGGWNHFTTDSGIKLNTQQVVSVKEIDHKEKIIKVLETETKSFWSGVRYHYEELK